MSLFPIPVFPLSSFPARLVADQSGRAERINDQMQKIRGVKPAASLMNSLVKAIPIDQYSAALEAQTSGASLSVESFGSSEVVPTTWRAFDGPKNDDNLLTVRTLTDRADDLAIEAVVDCKGEQTISVCIPAHNEERTIGAIVRALHSELVVKRQLVDEVIVMDDRSTDRTAEEAQAAGALVVSTNEVCVADGPSQGKGDALRRSIVAARGSIVVWVDGDLESMAPSIVARLVAPLLLNQQAQLTKGYFARRQSDGSIAGGRVTELVARPLLRLCFPAMVPPREPLSGMCAIRRSTAERLTYERDFGVDIGIVLDVHRRHGRTAIIDVDLGEITHRHHDLSVLSVQATAVARTILSRAQHPALVH